MGFNEFIEYLQNLRIENSGNRLIRHLNINSFRKKVDMLPYMIGKKIDILMISESKLNDTFPTSQVFQLLKFPNFSSFKEPFSLDRSGNKGAILLFC